MPDYEITISVHVPDGLVSAAKLFEQTQGRMIRSEVYGTAYEPTGDCVSHVKPVVEEKPEPVETEPVETKPAGPVTLEQAKAAVIAWAEKNGGPAKAKDNLAKNFGIKMSEMDESQAEAVFIHFSGGAN